MAHYALINNDNLVVSVITGVDEDVTQIDENGMQVGGSSEAWENYYASLPWFNGLTCKRTSYHGKIRKNYAGIDYTYDSQRDAFIAPKPLNAIGFDEATCQWIVPDNEQA